MAPGISEGQSARHTGQITGRCKPWPLYSFSGSIAL